jgi:hypothetical protein
MSTEYYIVDNPKPLSLDFASLKKEGLGYIQEHMGNDWNNLNSSDPGITILDQLCYALTELGYCNDFPMEDILTDRSGNLELQDRFYLPEDILTISPVTINDLRKLIGDEVEGVDNLLFLPQYGHSGIFGLYQPYLRISDKVTDSAVMQDICKAVFFLANKARNLGEIFLMPVPFTKATRCLQGCINITHESALDIIVPALQEAINNYVFPKMVLSGYERLRENHSARTDEVFNGPKLNNGWITDEALGTKRDIIRVADLTKVILSVPGIQSATDILFTQPDTNGLKNSASAGISEILWVDIAGSISPSPDGVQLTITCNGKSISIEKGGVFPIISLREEEPNILFGASSANQTTIPKGTYRDIPTYYSIQHTFPEIFRVGDNAMVSDKDDFQVAQSRQLKGYLTLFDQVLANQFSQLAALGQLFSFKNATTGAPTDRHHYYAIKDEAEIANPKYPVPFRSFSPTYFYQSVYDIPNVEPLLKNNDVFDFGSDPVEQAALQKNQSWIDYQNDPYNSYMQGLMNFMEDEKVNLKRRNEILDHLLARHGESPAMIDALIDGEAYSGKRLKDFIIIKSLYLQNLGLLSYYRCKAHNFLGARRISPEMSNLEEKFAEKIPGWDSVDFIINTEKIDQSEKLKQQDFIDYSAFELKLCLLLGFKAIYRNYLSSLFESGNAGSDEAKTAMWLITQRRGFIFLESSLLNFYTSFNDESGEPVEQLKSNELILVLPAFVPAFSSAAFLNRLDLYIQQEIPVRLKCRYFFTDAETFSKLIPAFTDWHNCLVFHNQEHIFNSWLQISSIKLIQIINNLQSANNE